MNNMLVIFVIILLTFDSITSFPLDQPPNEKWTCQGCDINIDILKQEIFGFIRQCIFKEQRNVYFAFDSSWMDRILLSESKVHVTILDPYNIRDTIMPSIQSLPENEADETFQIIYSELKDNQKFDYYGIDHFLSRNPCWLPLHEPIDLGQIQGITRIKKLKHFLELQNRSVIFIRLPVFGFHATCRLYTQITKHQNPKECIYDDNHMLVHHLHNTGWSATFNAVLFKLANILVTRTYPSKVLIITRAIDFRSHNRYRTDINGTSFNQTGGWYWSNPDTCHPDIDSYDPWACNFISISNCTRKERGVSIMNPPYPIPSGDYPFEYPGAIFEKDFDTSFVSDTTIKQDYIKYKDGYKADAELWSYYRLHAFLQRPNFQMRQHMRKSFKSLTLVDFIINQKKANHMPQGYLLSSYMKKPCLAMHVRHGDSMIEFRASKPIDRSFESHISHAFNMTTGLGISNIFIASDNLSVITNSFIKNPEYHWYTQRRPIKEWGMYDVHNEDDIQLELAHVFVDLRFAANCEAMIGIFDSGFTEQMIVSMCSHSLSGTCPPSVDLRKVFNTY